MGTQNQDIEQTVITHLGKDAKTAFSWLAVVRFVIALYINVFDGHSVISGQI